MGALGKSDLVRHIIVGDHKAASVAVLVSTMRSPDHIGHKMVARRLQNLPVSGAHPMPLGVLDIRIK
jgi:hypothetical protein